MGFITKKRYGKSYMLRLAQHFFDYFDLKGKEDIQERFKNFQDVSEEEVILESLDTPSIILPEESPQTSIAQFEESPQQQNEQDEQSQEEDSVDRESSQELPEESPEQKEQGDAPEQGDQ